MAALGPPVAGVSSRLAGPEEGRVLLAFDLAAAAKLKRGRVDDDSGVIDQWVTVCTDAARVDPRGCSVFFLVRSSHESAPLFSKTRAQVRNYVQYVCAIMCADWSARSVPTCLHEVEQGRPDKIVHE